MVVENGEGTGTGGGDAGGAGATGGGAEGGVGGGAPPAGGVGAASGTPPPDGGLGGGAPAFAPNFKYKFLGLKDGQEQQIEQEFDDLFKPLIKDAESEKKLREFHEKAYGLDYTKHRLDTVRGEHETVQGELGGLKQNLQYAGNLIKSGDFDGFFEMLSIPPQMVLQWALQHAQRLKDPAAAQQHANWRNQNKQMLDLQLRNQELESGYSDLSLNTRKAELEQVLARPEVSSVSQAYDAAIGRVGAFKSEIIRLGQWYANVQKQDVGAETLAMELIGKYGNLAKSAQPSPAGGPTPGVVAPKETKPVIPNVSGNGKSPVKTAVKSIDDLHRIRAEKMAAANAN